jgi:Zn-dependent protease
VSADVEQKLVFFGCLFAAIILHEISHGVVALFFGDDTAKKAGRLTLNPIPHIDPFGSIILPAMMTLAGLGAFGWAKPVPVNPSKLRNTRRDMVYVGLAGPITNFILMAGSAFAGRFAYHAIHPSGSFLEDLPLLIQVLYWFAYANLLLGLFNLLPVPPLDGSSLVERVLPEAWLPGWYKYRQYGFLILFALVFVFDIFTPIIRPFQDALFRFIFLS